MELWVVWIKIALIGLTSSLLFLLWLDVRRSAASRRSILAISIILAFATAYFAFMQGGQRNSKLVGSPDGRYVARIMVSSGTLVDGGPSLVIIRKPRSIKWTRVYAGDGYFQETGPAMPYIHWMDGRHLVIDYQGIKDVQTKCLSKVDDIVIECRAHYW